MATVLYTHTVSHVRGGLCDDSPNKRLAHIDDQCNYRTAATAVPTPSGDATL